MLNWRTAQGYPLFLFFAKASLERRATIGNFFYLGKKLKPTVYD
jgi:hypothetical protein